MKSERVLSGVVGLLGGAISVPLAWWFVFYGVLHTLTPRMNLYASNYGSCAATLLIDALLSAAFLRQSRVFAAAFASAALAVLLLWVLMTYVALWFGDIN